MRVVPMMYTNIRKLFAIILLIALSVQGGLGFGLHALDVGSWRGERHECSCHQIHDEVAISASGDCQVCKCLAVAKRYSAPLEPCVVSSPNPDHGIASTNFLRPQEFYLPAGARGPPSV